MIKKYTFKKFFLQCLSQSVSVYPHKTSIVWIYMKILFPVIELNQRGRNYSILL